MWNLRSRKPRSANRRRDASSELETVIVEVVRRRGAGEHLDDTTIQREHQHLMPTLGERLRALRAIEAAAQRARQDKSARSLECPNQTIPEDLKYLGDALSGYQVLERVEYGGQGVVYKAIQLSTQRTVALKVLLDGPLASDGQRDRFAREVRLISRLQHPNIVTIFDSGVVRGRYYFAMEFVDGFPIDDYAMLHGLSIRGRVRLFSAVCRAVNSAHRRGIMHRDLKPKNILVDQDGQPHILDFGLAKDTSQSVGNDRTNSTSYSGQIVGTLPYMSPEQVSADLDAVDVRSDVYSLGVVLFELLSERFPYPVDGTPESVRASIVSSEPQRLSAVLSREAWDGRLTSKDISDDLEVVVGKALKKEKSDRYQTPDALADDLDRYLRGEAVNAKADRRSYLLMKALRKHRVPAFVAAAFLLVAGALGGFGGYFWLDSKGAHATAELRGILSRTWDLELLNELQRSQARAFRAAELESLPVRLHAAHMMRYSSPPVELDAIFKATAKSAPRNLIQAIRDGDHADEEAKRWLENLDPELDLIADTVSMSRVAFPVRERTGYLIGADNDAWAAASVACEVLIARAYSRQALGDVDGALADLKAARWLAADIGDGITLMQKASSIFRRQQIYIFLREALAEGLGNKDAVQKYLSWLQADPIIVGCWPALACQELVIKQLVKASFVTDPVTRANYLDFDLLASITGGLFSPTHESREYMHGLHPEQVNSIISRYVGCARDWDQLTFVQLDRAITERSRALRAEPKENLLLYLFPDFGNPYRCRLFTRTLRRALIVAAFTARYKHDHGAWPSSLEKATPEEFHHVLIDPMTGKDFTYDVVDNAPRFRSALNNRTQLSNKLVRPAAEIRRFVDAEGQVTYFPPQQRD